MTKKLDAATIAHRIAQGRGAAEADLVVANVRLYDLVTGMTPTDIAVCGDTIVGTYGAYRGVRTIEGRGRIAVPGFIDTHLHVESSLVSPLEFDRCVLPCGVTAICDPHEMANVIGTAAFDYFLESPSTRPWTCGSSCRAAFRRPISKPPARGSRRRTLRTTGGTARSSALPSS